MKSLFLSAIDPVLRSGNFSLAPDFKGRFSLSHEAASEREKKGFSFRNPTPKRERPTSQKKNIMVVVWFQSQLEDLQTSHSSELARLHKQIDELDNQIIRLQMKASQG